MILLQLYAESVHYVFETSRRAVDSISDSRAKGLIPSLATYFICPSTDSRRAVVIYWQKYGHSVLFNRLGSLPPLLLTVEVKQQHL